MASFSNGRGIAHQGSGGRSAVFPDVCLTPQPHGPVPIPYPNLGQSADTAGGSVTVTVDGHTAMVKGAHYAVSSGDEPGSVGGVVSGTHKGRCEFMLYSFDVKIEGQNTCRLGDPLVHNDRNAMG